MKGADHSGVSRRTFIAAGAAAAGAVALPLGGSSATARAAAPPPRGPIGFGGEPTEPARLAELAREIAGGDAVTFLDLAAFDANLANYERFATRQGWHVRPALKSFQSPQFAGYALARLRRPRGMPFYLRTVDDILRAAPRGTDLMLGYPPTIGELEEFLGTRAPRGVRGQRVRVMVDSIELLRAFARLARRARRDDVEVALQLESGFELSGLRTAEQLGDAIRLLRAERRRLKLTAVMCYDGHGAAVPSRSFQQQVVDEASRRFDGWLAQLRRDGADLFDERTLVRNGPASSTYRLWAGERSLNEMSPGAGLLFHGYITGTGYDNEGLQPTLHHAAPVFRITVPQDPLQPAPRAEAATKDSVAVRGGAWPSNDGRVSVPVFPDGLEVDEGAGGTGNNQSNFLVEQGTLRRGDYAVFRPRNAGDAIDHFHALVAVRDGVPRAVWRTQRRPGAVRL